MPKTILMSWSKASRSESAISERKLLWLGQLRFNYRWISLIYLEIKYDTSSGINIMDFYVVLPAPAWESSDADQDPVPSESSSRSPRRIPCSVTSRSGCTVFSETCFSKRNSFQLTELVLSLSLCLSLYSHILTNGEVWSWYCHTVCVYLIKKGERGFFHV